MDKDFTTIYRSLNFLSESVRLQYSNFIFRNYSKLLKILSIEDIVAKIQKNEPIEYIFNLAEFCDLEFYVDNRCLIPRPETQEIVNNAVELAGKISKEKNITIVDVGTGSGCIILSVAKKLTQLAVNNVKYIGIDISTDALKVAHINLEKHELDQKVEFLQNDFREYDFSIHENLIVCSNLPYIPNSEKLQSSVIDYEPHLALFGGEVGHELNNELISKLKLLDNVKALLIEGASGKIDKYYY